MATTMTLITSYEVTGSTTSSIDITSIPSTYTDLWIKFSSRHTTAGSEDTPTIRFNNDSASNYTFTFGGSVSSNNLPSSGATTTSIFCGTLPGAGDTSGSYSTIDIRIPSYAGTTFKKTIDVESVSGGAIALYRRIIGGYWNSTAAINRVTMQVASGSSYNFALGTTIYVYGIKNS
jgi:hypothetical protein